jgi:hypothetical protein
MSDSVERVIGNGKAEGLKQPTESTAIEETGLPGEVDEINPLAESKTVTETPYQPEADKNTEEGSTTDQPNP